MGCKSNCKGCSDTLVGNTQKSLVAYIQPCGAGRKNPTYSAMTDGDWPAVKVTGKSRNWRGARTNVWRRNSDGTSSVCHVTEATPGDNTVTLEFADCGCGGYSPDELAEQGSFDLYEAQRCCGLADLEQGWSKMKVTRCVTFSGVDESPSTSYDTAEDGDLTRTYTGGLFVNSYTIYPITFGEVAVATGIDTGARITGFTYANSRAGCTTQCKDQCTSAWYAITNDGNLIYKTGSDYAIANSQIPGFTASLSTKIGQSGNMLFVASVGILWSTTLDKNGNPTTWTSQVIASFVPDGVEPLSDGSLLFYGASTGANFGVIYKVTKTGVVSQYYYNAVAATNVQGVSECGSVIGAVLNSGEVVRAVGSCGTMSATTSAPLVGATRDFTIQPGGSYWVITNTGVYFSNDDGETWETVSLPGATPTALREILWVDAGVGYIVADQASTPIYATIDGGLTWTIESTGDRINTDPVGFASIGDARIPCCTSQTANANAIAISGTTTTGVGGLWLGGVQSC